MNASGLRLGACRRSRAGWRTFSSAATTRARSQRDGPRASNHRLRSARSSLMAFGGWSGYRLTANHYQALIAADRDAQDKALSQAQAATITAQQAQATASQQAEQQYA